MNIAAGRDNTGELHLPACHSYCKPIPLSCIFTHIIDDSVLCRYNCMFSSSSSPVSHPRFISPSVSVSLLFCHFQLFHFLFFFVCKALVYSGIIFPLVVVKMFAAKSQLILSKSFTKHTNFTVSRLHFIKEQVVQLTLVV